jgi:hypothetical protein
MNDINTSVMELVATKFNEPEELAAMAMVQGVVTEAGLTDQIKALDSIIRSLAWQCSFMQWRCVRGILKNVAWEYTSNDRKMIKDLVGNAVKAINSKAKAVAANAQPTDEQSLAGERNDDSAP